MKFLAAAMRVLKSKEVLNYREIFLSLKNAWKRISPVVIESLSAKFNPLVLKFYKRRQSFEPVLTEALEDFFEDYLETLPDDLKNEYF